MGAIQVTSSRKGAKSRTHGRKVRSNGTKASTPGRKPRAELRQQLGETRVLKHFQERMPYGLFVPDVEAFGRDE
jgi:hypothetical protein